MLPTLIGTLLLLVSTALGSTASASDVKTRVGVFEENGARFDVEPSAASVDDVSGKVVLTDGDGGGRNLCYNRFRYYDPHSGRYISPDPIGMLGGTNIHVYAPNASGWVDPYGLAKTSTGCEPQKLKFVFSNMPHAAQRGVVRAGFASVREARTALRSFTQKFEGGIGTFIIDRTNPDRIIVPGFQNNTAVVFRRVQSGKLEVRTVLQLDNSGLPGPPGRFSVVHT